MKISKTHHKTKKGVIKRNPRVKKSKLLVTAVLDRRDNTIEVFRDKDDKYLGLFRNKKSLDKAVKKNNWKII